MVRRDGRGGGWCDHSSEPVGNSRLPGASGLRRPIDTLRDKGYTPADTPLTRSEGFSGAGGRLMTIATRPARAIRYRDEEDLYPSSDGKPMAETELHRDLMIYSIEALKVRYAEDPNTQVSGNNF